MIKKHESIFPANNTTPDSADLSIQDVSIQDVSIQDVSIQDMSTQDTPVQCTPEQCTPVHQSHYVNNMIETIDIIQLVERQLEGSVDPYTGFCIGNVIKYVSRFPFKGHPIEDLEKAKVYTDYIIDHLRTIGDK